ncbi:amphi-Trp domain [Spongiibacter sp. IMCC21906]|jgi:amphi-Trp domain-containing protein|uniref:amphi-Trp domain-containing protein n=1 Tax=Spongiibacter sp. IMCC21906 TaxID=1620392 RepID=UPI00062DF590|nr:amphi-Trp domain-containing protein [Spongiibacter sp. IMCC21906]AKH69294.1 amphi-Trp domain [Spongiibacter sp. IMCC21906]
MHQAKASFRHESLQDSKSIQEFLKAISKGLGKGKLQFSDEEGKIVMLPEGLLNLKLTATQDESRHRIDLRISWQSDDEHVEPKTLQVSSD